MFAYYVVFHGTTLWYYNFNAFHYQRVLTEDCYTNDYDEAKYIAAQRHGTEVLMVLV